MGTRSSPASEVARRPAPATAHRPPSRRAYLPARAAEGHLGPRFEIPFKTEHLGRLSHLGGAPRDPSDSRGQRGRRRGAPTVRSRVRSPGGAQAPARPAWGAQDPPRPALWRRCGDGLAAPPPSSTPPTAAAEAWAARQGRGPPAFCTGSSRFGRKMAAGRGCRARRRERARSRHGRRGAPPGTPRDGAALRGQRARPRESRRLRPGGGARGGA